MRPAVFASTLVTLALAAAPAFAVVACPTSTYLYGGLDPTTPIVVVAATQETTFAIHNPACDFLHGSYMVTVGLMQADVVGCPLSAGCGPDGLETIVEDDFMVTGPANGTPVTFDAVLELNGSVECFSAPDEGGGARARGLIREGAANEVSVMRTTSIPLVPSLQVQESLTLPVSAVAGTLVHMHFAIRGEALDGRAILAGKYRFDGLPAGAIMTSCRGYDPAAATPAHASTWGSLKARYR